MVKSRFERLAMLAFCAAIFALSLFNPSPPGTGFDQSAKATTVKTFQLGFLGTVADAETSAIATAPASADLHERLRSVINEQAHVIAFTSTATDLIVDGASNPATFHRLRTDADLSYDMTAAASIDNDHGLGAGHLGGRSSHHTHVDLLT